ncbi:hypothetical protein KAH55_14755, partial [bacterium]|nr:hypothetical protein [bacterium]
MMKYLRIISIFLLLFAIKMPAGIIQVPDSVETIQAAIDSAVFGDTVLVAEGEYVETIDFLGKPLVIASHFLLDADTSHISTTIINPGSLQAPAVVFATGEDSTSVLLGFTITGGRGATKNIGGGTAKMGGGILIADASATISHNQIIGNQLLGDNLALGGGIVAFVPEGHTLIIANNKIRDNSVHGIDA